MPAPSAYVVKPGDTLWDISLTHLGSPLRYQALAKANCISDPNYIVVGQRIMIATTPTAKPASSPLKASVQVFGALSTDTNRLYAKWEFRKSNLKGFKVVWEYQTLDGKWIVGSNTETTHDDDVPSECRQSLYTIPSGAIQVMFKVKPVAETNKDTDEPYWDNTQWVTKYYTNSTPLTTPSKPSVKMEGYTLTATLENVNISGADSIEFQVYKNDTTKVSSGSNTVVAISATNSVSYTYVGSSGNTYKVRCRACNTSKKLYSEWSSFSDSTGTVPSAPAGIKTIKASSETSVYLEWVASTGAETYSIEYSEKEEYFDGSDQTTTKSGIETTHYTITGLQTGTQWFFRLRASNSSGDSEWTALTSIIIGTTPTAPTTWSSTTTAVKGEPVWLYWIHNVEDGSTQTRAQIEVTVNGSANTVEITDDSSNYEFDTSSYSEGAEMKWRVRTAGVTTDWGEWSTQRIITVHAPVELEFSITNSAGNSFDTLSSFPFRAHAVAGPKTQAPTGYNLSVISDSVYETVDSVGNVKMVNAGEQVYSQYFDTSDVLDVELSAGNLDLENGQSYTITCTVAMNSGLTSEASIPFTVEWSEESYIPDAEVNIDKNTFAAYIRPFCDNKYWTYYKVDNRNVVTTTSIDAESVESLSTDTGEVVHLGKTSTGAEIYYGVVYTNDAGGPIDPVYYVVSSDASGVYRLTSTVLDPTVSRTVYTSTGEEVLLGVMSDGSVVRYCEVEKSNPIADIYLSVYRREFDGSFTEIATNLDSSDNTVVTDPHPALDYARYRIVATTKSTGEIGYYDIPAVPVGGKAVIIQWDEQWSNFDYTEDGTSVEPSWAGSLLKLPYNIDVSDSHKNDVSLIEYIGRSHPVSYYGTQLGESSTWSVNIEKNDEETLYGLRRLAKWMGDAYVREPSGSGYWATVSVSFNQKHLATIIPVTLSITRVEGGM